MPRGWRPIAPSAQIRRSRVFSLAADPKVMPAWRVLWMATVEGARAIGLGDEIGSLRAAKRRLHPGDLRRPTLAPACLY